MQARPQKKKVRKARFTRCPKCQKQLRFHKKRCPTCHLLQPR
jgi:predicted amidophosphoribosyltransferase